MPRFGHASRKRLATCHPLLQELFNEVILTFDCKIICGHRSQEEQNEAYRKGASKLRWPDSKHNKKPALAVDVVPFPLDWKDTNRMYYFAGFVKAKAEDLGIKVRWGGDWDGDTEVSDEDFRDYPHHELCMDSVDNT